MWKGNHIDLEDYEGEHLTKYFTVEIISKGWGNTCLLHRALNHQQNTRYLFIHENIIFKEEIRFEYV